MDRLRQIEQWIPPRYRDIFNISLKDAIQRDSEQQDMTATKTKLSSGSILEAYDNLSGSRPISTTNVELVGTKVALSWDEVSEQISDVSLPHGIFA